MNKDRLLYAGEFLERNLFEPLTAEDLQLPPPCRYARYSATLPTPWAKAWPAMCADDG